MERRKGRVRQEASEVALVKESIEERVVRREDRMAKEVLKVEGKGRATRGRATIVVN